jgi:ferredoxin-NADP reductase
MLPTVGHFQADQAGKDYHSQGRISIETVKALMPGRQAKFYLCGPNAFMREIHDGLVEWGIPVERIHFELFGPSTVMPGKTRTPPPTAPAYRIAFGAGADPILWDGKATLLDAAFEPWTEAKVWL